MSLNTHKIDADESVAFARQLEAIEPKVYQKLFPQYKARTLFPVDNSGGKGVQFITYYLNERIGSAQLISDYANDFRRVNVRRKKYTAPVAAYGESIVYSMDEIDAANRAGEQLDASMAVAAREGYEQRFDEIAFAGDSTSGLVGALNNPNVPIVSLAAAGLWTAKTADQIINDFAALLKSIPTVTNDVHQATTVIMPVDSYELIKRMRLGSTNETTVLKFLLDTNPGLQIEKSFRLATAGAGSTRRMMAYQKDADVLSLREPEPFMIHPFQQDMLVFKAPCVGKMGGMVIRYPLACAYMDGF